MESVLLILVLDLCVVFLVVFLSVFVLCMSCVPNVASISGLYIIDCPLVLSNVYLIISTDCVNDTMMHDAIARNDTMMYDGGNTSTNNRNMDADTESILQTLATKLTL